MINIKIELKKLKDTGEYSPNKLKEIKEQWEYENEVEKQAERERKQAERERKQAEREEKRRMKLERLGKYRTEQGKFLHYLVAEDMTKDNPCININGSIAIWDGYAYTFDVLEFVRTRIKGFDKETTKRDRIEVYNTIVDNIYDYPKFTQVDKYRIAFNNGILNISTLEFNEGTHQEYAILNHIPHDYVENVDEQPEVKQWIMNLADNDERVYKLLLQLIGYPMLVNCNLRTAFMLMGKAQGGKTKFMEHVQYIYGNKNYTTFDIDEINSRFNRVQTCGKLFNYSDDIDSGYIEKPNFLKRLISGLSLMQVEKKGVDGYGLPFYAKIIMSMNEFPKIKLDSDITAWQSRLNIINFKHKFEKNPKYEEWVEAKLKTPNAISWLIQESVKAINEAVEDGGFCYYDNEAFDRFIENINPILSKALEMKLDDWKEIYDIKQWYDEQKELTSSKTSFNAFMNMFNHVSTRLEIYKGRKKSKALNKTIFVFRIRDKSQQ